MPGDNKFPSWKQGLVLFGGGAVLAVSACFGCLFTLDANQVVPWTLGILAVGGFVATLVGGVFILMRIVRALFAKSPSAPPPTLSSMGPSTGPSTGPPSTAPPTAPPTGPPSAPPMPPADPS